MKSTIEQFVDILESSGVLSLDETEAFIGRLPNSKRPSDASSLAADLVREGMITSYQAERLIAGDAEALEFGKYCVIEHLGAGGMGKVFKVRHRLMTRVDAIKVLPRAFLRSPEAIRRFHQEVRIAARLDHPNIVRTFDADDKDGVYFLVMEYVDGTNIGELIAQQGSLPVKQAIDITIQAARGLQYAHDQGVIHRDVKPSNLMLDRNGVVRLLDLGLASLEEKIGPMDETGLARLTQLGQLMGTYAYMAPEQATDARHADARADIYSLGCTLHALLTGEPPYQGETPIHVLMAHREQELPSLCERDETIPTKLDRVFRKMLGKQPEERYETMHDVIAALEKCSLKRTRNYPYVRASSVRYFDSNFLTSVIRMSVLLVFGPLAIVGLTLFVIWSLGYLRERLWPPPKQNHPSPSRTSTAGLVPTERTKLASLPPPPLGGIISSL